MLHKLSSMKQILFFLLFLFGHLTVNAQIVYFNNRYNNDIWSAALTISETDLGYVVCGISGEISNGYVFNRIVLTAIDNEGDQLWWKTYGEDFHNYYAGGIGGFIKTTEGGYVVSGVIEDTIRNVGLLLKFDQNGDSLWSRIYGDTVSLDYSSTIFNVCVQLPDNGFLIAGYVFISEDDADIILIRTDYLGNTLWNYNYGELHWLEAAWSIAQLPESKFLIGVGRQQVGENTSMDPGLLKVDSLGNQIWIRYYGGIYDDAGSAVILSQDGNYLFGSAYAIAEPHIDYPEQKVWIFKTDTAGNILWERIYSDKVFVGWCGTIDELSDGSIIAAGSGGFEDSPSTEGWIIKTNQYGDSIWMRRYSYYPFNLNYLYDLRVTSDDGIIFTGYTMGDPEWEQSIWIQKLDSIGCDSVKCDTTVGIYEEHGGMGAWGHGSLEIWPNPASDWIHILFRDNGLNWFSDREIQIFNVFGDKVDENRIPHISDSYSYNV